MISKMDSQQTISDATSASHGPSRRYYWINLAGVIAGGLCLNVGYTAFFFIMTSLHGKGGLGGMALAVDYATQVLSCLFLPTFLLRTIGCKWTMVACGVTIVIFIGTNMKSSVETLIPGAVVVGIGYSTLSATLKSVVSDLAVGYARLMGISEVGTLQRFFSIESGFIATASIWSNLLSSQMLSSPTVDADNKSLPHLACGAQYCDMEEQLQTDFNSSHSSSVRSVSQSEINSLAGACIGFVGIGIILIITMLHSYKPGVQENTESYLDRALATVRLLRDPNMLLLIIITITIGLMSSFMAADFTKGFVTCSLGIQKVGLVIMCMEIVVCLVNFVSGLVSLFVPRIVLFLVAAALIVVDLLLMLFWTPDPQFPAMFYIVVSVWGVTYMVWMAQFLALYGDVFPGKHQEAYSNHRTWECVGFVTGFAWSHGLCVSTKIYIIMGFLVIGIVGYLMVERRLTKRRLAENKMTSSMSS